MKEPVSQSPPWPGQTMKGPEASLAMGRQSDSSGRLRPRCMAFTISLMSAVSNQAMPSAFVVGIVVWRSPSSAQIRPGME